MSSSIILLASCCIHTRFHVQLAWPWLPCLLLTTQMFLSYLPIVPAQSFGSPPTDTSTDSFNHSVSTTIVISAVISVLFLIFIIVAVLYCLHLANKKIPDQASILPSVNAGTPKSQVNAQQVDRLTSSESINQKSWLQEKRVTFQQVVMMTENFTFELGVGGFGAVYYGKTSSGEEVAVKRLSAGSAQGSSEFLSELEILLRAHHRNLVRLIGYCSEFKELILIYEYMRGGTLHDHLHGGRKPLDMEKRITIAVDCANGLKYLHTDCDPRIVHRDVKASNILLDEKLTGKVADFGLSKTFQKPSQTHISTVVKGTIGYLDPEYALGLDRLTDKSDVYSFGIVLLELLTGRKPIVETSSGIDYVNISNWARPFILGDQLDDIVDKSMGGDYNMEALKQVAILALWCVEPKGAQRPSMIQVCEKLETILRTYLKPMPTIGALHIDISSPMPSLETSPSQL